MDIKAHGVRSSGPADIRPVAGREIQRTDFASTDLDDQKTARELTEQQSPLTDATTGISDAVVALQEFAQSIQRDLAFRMDDSSGRVVVEVRDQASGEVIRQIPSEEALHLLKHLEDARSLMVNTKA